MISSAFAVLVVMILLAWSVHLCLAMLTVSTVTAVATDAARQVAADTVPHDDPAAVARAEHQAQRRARSELGRSADKVTFAWQASGDQVRLSVTIDQPWRIGPGWGPTRAFARVHRTIVVPVESAR